MGAFGPCQGFYCPRWDCQTCTTLHCTMMSLVVRKSVRRESKGIERLLSLGRCIPCSGQRRRPYRSAGSARRSPRLLACDRSSSPASALATPPARPLATRPVHQLSRAAIAPHSVFLQRREGAPICAYRRPAGQRPHTAYTQVARHLSQSLAHSRPDACLGRAIPSLRGYHRSVNCWLRLARTGNLALTLSGASFPPPQ